MQLKTLLDRFDEAAAILEPMGHGLIIRHTRCLMDAGEFVAATVFVQEAARRLSLGTLSDLGREINV